MGKSVRFYGTKAALSLIVTTVLLKAALTACGAAAPRTWSVATADTIIARYPDYRTAYFRPWTYVHGYVLFGFEMLYRSTGDKKYFDYMKRYIDSIVDDKGNLTYVDRKTGALTPVSLSNLDNMMTGNLIVAMYEYTHGERYKIAADHIRKAFALRTRVIATVASGMRNH